MLTTAPSQPLKGMAALPGDKSLSHRTALFAALARGESRIENFLVAGVTHAMLDALTSLGIEWELDGTTLQVNGKGLHGFQVPPGSLDCGNSATTIRMLAGAIAASGTPAVLDGSDGLRRRPMGRIVEPLQQMGVPVMAAKGRAPISLSARAPQSRLAGKTHELKVASAQVKSCILLAALAAGGKTTVIEPGPSRDHTERLLASMGAAIESEKRGTQYVTTLVPKPGMELSPLDLALPGDISSAAFLIVAALVTPGSEIILQGVGLNPTRTGLMDALQQMGADIQVRNRAVRNNEPVGDVTVRASALRGIRVDGPLVVRMIDEFPVFSVAAAYAEGETVVRDAVELRHKESDRITALCRQLRNVGVAVEELEDGFRIAGSTPPVGGEVNPNGDHRLAMSLAVAGLGAKGAVSIHDPEIIHESFPGFKAALEHLGAEIDG